MKRVWIVKYWDPDTISLNIDRIFNNLDAAVAYMTEAEVYRDMKIESWKVYSTWPEEWPAINDRDCYPNG